jgi:DNA-directed RNA polymerase specialized sigma24 family protein
MPPDPSATMIEQEIIVAERNAALRAAFAELPQPCRELLSLLMSDPAPAYAEISARLGMAIGSIGPTRARCLDRLRRSPQLVAVLDDQAGDDIEVDDIEIKEPRGEQGD